MNRRSVIALWFLGFLISPSLFSLPMADATASAYKVTTRSAMELNSASGQSVPVTQVRAEIQTVSDQAEVWKSSLPHANHVDDIFQVLQNYVKELQKLILQESLDMTVAERQMVANAHFETALLHLSSVLPALAPTVTPTSLFYSPASIESSSSVKRWKDDWLVRLAMAVEEDSANAAGLDNALHYIPHGIFPLDLPAALYHLNKAALLGHASGRSLFALLAKMASRSVSPSTPLPSPNFHKLVSQPDAEKITTADLVKRAADTVPGSKAQSSKSESGPSSAAQKSPSGPIVPKMIDWKILERTFQDLGAAAQSPSALFAEGYNFFLGSDTYHSQCAHAKAALRDTTAPLLEIMKQRTPSPILEFDEHALPPIKLMEEYSSQSMGFYKAPSEFEKIDLIDYYRYQANDPQQYLAKNTIGSIYLYGSYGFARSYERATEYFSQSNSVHPSAHLGYMHHMGLLSSGVNVQSAVSLYSKAAAQNNSFALTQLGLMYLRGNKEANIQAEPKRALVYLQKAAEKEDTDANFHLGVLYRSGYGSDLVADHSKALKHIISAATRGHLGALLELATLTGKCEDAVHLYLRVLNSVLLNPLAYRAHEFYSFGFYNEAAVLYNLMAALGHETGQLNAAWLHERGLVTATLTPQDLANLLPLNFPKLLEGTGISSATVSSQFLHKSFDSLDKSLNEFEPDAFIDHDGVRASSSALNRHEDELGLESALIVDPSTGKRLGDREEIDEAMRTWQQRHAFELYRLAAQQGSAEAQLKQGDFFYYGIGVDKDYNRSAQFYQLASLGKHAQATFNLGVMYQRGLGVPKDLHLAKRYYDMALSSSPDAYLASSLALISLYAQDLFFGSSATNAISLDNYLLGFLVVLGIVTLLWKWRLRT